MIGAVIDGCPAGLRLDLQQVQVQLNRRKPGQWAPGSSRAEDDAVQVVSGLYEGVTIGTPLTLLIHNKDQRSADYEPLKDVYRPSHADFTYERKYGVRDPRGGGRSSARVTAAVVAAGAVARQLLTRAGITVLAYVEQAGEIASKVNFLHEETFQESFQESIEANAMRCPDPQAAAEMEAWVRELKENGDSCGGIIACEIFGTPPGLGAPLFNKLQADLAAALFSINTVHGFEYGSGFAGASRKGSEHNDAFILSQGKVKTGTNHSGGIQGGISNGMKINFRAAFKPVASIAKEQITLNRAGESVRLGITGRHDACVLPRAVPIVEAMAALVLADHWLLQRTAKISTDEKD